MMVLVMEHLFLVDQVMVNLAMGYQDQVTEYHLLRLLRFLSPAGFQASIPRRNLSTLECHHPDYGAAAWSSDPKPLDGAPFPPA